MSYNKEEDYGVDEDDEAAPRPHAAENEAAPRPPVVENDDDVDDDDNDDDIATQAEHADAQPPAEAEQPGNPPREIAGVGVADQGEEHDEAIFPEIQGVDKEVIEPETPGVGMVEENEVGKNGDDQPTQDVATGQLPLAPPQEDDYTEGRYNLCSDQNCNYNH